MTPHDVAVPRPPRPPVAPVPTGMAQCRRPLALCTRRDTSSPDTSAPARGQVLQQLTNGIGGWALVLSLVGLLIGAAAWALGSHGQNYQQSYVGPPGGARLGTRRPADRRRPGDRQLLLHAGPGRALR